VVEAINAQSVAIVVAFQLHELLLIARRYSGGGVGPDRRQMVGVPHGQRSSYHFDGWQNRSGDGTNPSYLQ
jgi:hypothetical protein